MDQMSLFDMAEDSIAVDTTKKLKVVKAQFIKEESMSWQELFEGYDEIYAITFSSGMQFMTQLLDQFEYAEVIFGCEGLVDDALAGIMAFERALIEKITKNKPAHKMRERMETGELKLYVSRDMMSHEKVFCLKAKDGRTRVIEGSANMSASAFCGLQRENITYYDDKEAYEHFKARYEAFREVCADHVNETAFVRTMEEREFLENHPEEIPIMKNIEKRKMIIIESEGHEEDEVEFIANVKGLEAELKPMLPKPKKSEGKIVITAEQTQKFYKSHREHLAEKKEKQRRLPKLYVDYDLNKLFFNGKECNLYPEKEMVQTDIRCLLNYLSCMDVFYGDVEQARKDYYAFMNWYFLSLFMPYVRYTAFKNSYDITDFPVVGVIYGESNGGKSTFLRMLSKLMCNVKIPLNSTNDFTATNIDALRRGCEGLPINIDDLDRQQFKNHADKIIKVDEWGVAECYYHYPAIAITTNQLPSLEAAIAKRFIGCRINARIDKEAGVKNAKKINESIRNVTNSLYCEYVRRMLPEIAVMIEEIKAGKEEYYPDVFKLSSTILLDIFQEFVPGETPEYFTVLTRADYFGQKVVGRNAINRILTAWESEKKQFKIDKKKNLLIYSYPAGANTYELKYICDELPAQLNARVASRSLIMDLDRACEFFEVKFRKKIVTFL